MNTITPQIKQWKVGFYRLAKAEERIKKLEYLAELIKRAEDEHANLIAYSKSEVSQWFPQLRAKAIREAAGRMAAHQRLVRYFNAIANELSL